MKRQPHPSVRDPDPAIHRHEQPAARLQDMLPFPVTSRSLTNRNAWSRQPNRILFLAGFLYSLHLLLPTAAAITLSLPGFAPANPWLGQSVQVSVSCTDPNNTITSVTANITGPGITFLPFTFSPAGGDNYTLTLSNSYLDRTGLFTVLAICNNNTEEATSSGSFTVSHLSGTITSIQPAAPYTGDALDVYFMLAKDNTPIQQAATFQVSLDGSIVTLLPGSLVYDTILGWRLKLAGPAAGNHTLVITASYAGATITNTTAVTVQDPVTFVLLSADQSMLQPGDLLTLTIHATDHGAVPALSASQFSIKVGGATAAISSLTKTGSDYELVVAAPQLSPGNYDVKTTFTHQNFSDTKTISVTYPVPVSGTLLDSAGRPVQAKLSFAAAGSISTLTTSSTGAFSGLLPPGSSQFNLSVGNSLLIFTGVDPAAIGSSLRVQPTPPVLSGLAAAGFLGFEAGFPYATVDAVIGYDDTLFPDENAIQAWFCQDWKQHCSSLSPIAAAMDTAKNQLTIPLAKPGGYLIGRPLQLEVEIQDIPATRAGAPLAVTGIVRDELGNFIDSAAVAITLAPGGEYATAASNAKGVFSATLTAPAEEGSYTATATASKDVYLPASADRPLIVEQLRELGLVLPQSVSVAVGGNKTAELTLINTGQVALEDIAITVDGPGGWFTASPAAIASLQPGEEQPITIKFFIPMDAPLTTHVVTVSAAAGKAAVKKSFALTIGQPTHAPIRPQSKPATGLLILPELTDTLLLGGFTLACFSAALVFRRRRRKAMPQAAAFLAEVREHINTPPTKEKRMRR